VTTDSRIPNLDAAAIDLALTRYLASDDPQFSDVRTWARYHHALPLIVDMGGCIALRPTGELISFDWDNEKEATLDVGPYNTHIARGVGSRKYPEIDGLAPVRPAQAKTCPLCGGSGSPEPGASNVVCRCGGLGWVPL
jgi:hypothetical protein